MRRTKRKRGVPPKGYKKIHCEPGEHFVYVPDRQEFRSICPSCRIKQTAIGAYKWTQN